MEKEVVVPFPLPLVSLHGHQGAAGLFAAKEQPGSKAKLLKKKSEGQLCQAPRRLESQAQYQKCPLCHMFLLC